MINSCRSEIASGWIALLKKWFYPCCSLFAKLLSICIRAQYCTKRLIMVCVHKNGTNNKCYNLRCGCNKNVTTKGVKVTKMLQPKVWR